MDVIFLRVSMRYFFELKACNTILDAIAIPSDKYSQYNLVLNVIFRKTYALLPQRLASLN